MKLLFAVLFSISALVAQTVDSAPRAQATFTVSTLPTASSWTNKIALVTDGSAAGDCTTGSGSTRVLCVSNGTTWGAVAGGGGSGALLHQQVSISSAQLKTLHASPPPLVTAPGSTSMFTFVGATAEFQCSSCTTYTAGGNVNIGYANGDGVSLSSTPGNFIAGPTSNKQFTFLPTTNSGSNILWPNDERNQGFVLQNWQSTEYATGTGTLVVDIWYTLSTGL